MKRLLSIFRNATYKGKLIILCVLVSTVPLTIVGIFCYYQTTHLLSREQLRSMENSLDTVSSSLNNQIVIYENLLTYIADNEVIVETPSNNYQTKYEQYEQLNYELDVFLKGLYSLHPEIQVTVYNATTTLTHGSQLRPITDLENESWYKPDIVTSKPCWYKNNDGTIILIQKIPSPYIKYIESYSDNLVCIKLDADKLFNELQDWENYSFRILSDTQILYDGSNPVISPVRTADGWRILSCDLSPENWKLEISTPTAILYEPVHIMILIVLTIILLCIIFIVFSSTSLAEVYVRRIDILLDNMQLVKSGHFEINIHDDCPDEIGELTNHFQTMVTDLNRLIREDYKNKLLLRETQLKALQAQINPHFLYNCLSLINSKAIMNRQPEISQMSQLLSTFYRTTLNKGKTDTLLQNEIKNVMAYLNIQKLLHDNTFDVMYQIDSDLPDIYVPNLLLQPLVENSLVHGILPNRDRRGNLFLSVTRINGQILFTVMDNGIGIDPEKLPKLLSTDSGGYGLKNVHERIQLSYGSGYGLSIQSIPNESTMITFRIPVKQNPAN